VNASPSILRQAQGRFTVGVLLRNTLRVWWSNVLAFTAVALVIELPLFALELRAGESEDPQGGALLLLFGWFLGLIASGALSFGVLQFLAGKRPGVSEMLSTAARRLWPLFTVAAVYGLTVMAGLFLLLVPGLVAMVGGYLAIPMVVEDPGIGTERALRRSWALTAGHRATLLLAVAVLLAAELLAVVGTDQLLAAAGLAKGPLTVGVLSLVSAVLSGFTSSCAAVAFHDLRALGEPRSQTEAKKPSLPWW
jgi:hypothetical protein